MSPSVFEWSWTGRPDSEAGTATYTTVDVVAVVDMRSFREANRIAAVMTDIEHKARERMRGEIANTCQDAIRRLRP